MEKRTASMELKAIRDQLLESPPPPPSGTSVREWFAGLALSNPSLMKDVEPTERAAEAVRLADELLRALLQPRVPQGIDGPTEDDLRRWEKRLADDAASTTRRNRQTLPDQSRAKKQAIVTAPETPAAVHFKAATETLRHVSDELPTMDLPSDDPPAQPPPRRSMLPSPTGYSTVNPSTKPETPFRTTSRPRRRPTRT